MSERSHFIAIASVFQTKVAAFENSAKRARRSVAVEWCAVRSVVWRFICLNGAALGFYLSTNNSQWCSVAGVRGASSRIEAGVREVRKTIHNNTALRLLFLRREHSITFIASSSCLNTEEVKCSEVKCNTNMKTK